MHGRNALKFGMLVYPDHVQNWLDFGRSVLIFLFWSQFWLSETSQIWGIYLFWKCVGVNVETAVPIFMIRKQCEIPLAPDVHWLGHLPHGAP